MTIQFYNTLTNRKEPFAPIDDSADKHVYMYNCGPTVYDFAHIGNFRAFVFADVLRRFLELTGHTVHQVMNITDVGHMTDDQLADGGGEDKMEKARKRLIEDKKAGKLPDGALGDPDDPFAIARYYENAFLEDARALGLRIADDPPLHRPRATEHVPQMQAMIRTLIDNGKAYVADDGAVYYDVSRFDGYGSLSGNTLDKLRGGAGGRVSDANQAVKRNPADFLLWKPDPSHIMKWDSAWGEGYPGWHIECSAMSLHVLSQLAGRELTTIDIHTGGEDNIFPHHECEIAQSCGCTGADRFANLWMHTRFLLVDGEKMSKSKGNFYTVRDVLEGRVTGRPVDPAVLRFELLKSHYRSNANFTAKGLEDAASAVTRLRNAMTEADAADAQAIPDATAHPVVKAFAASLADDLNISEAVAGVFEWLRSDAYDPHEARIILPAIDAVLAVSATPDTADDADVLCAQLDAARGAKDFATADALRQQLIDAGYDVQTTKDGTVARKKLA